MSYALAIARIANQRDGVIVGAVRQRSQMVTEGAAMAWQGLSRGKTASQLHREGMAVISGESLSIGALGDETASGVIHLLGNIFHVVLLIAGALAMIHGLGWV